MTLAARAPCPGRRERTDCSEVLGACGAGVLFVFGPGDPARGSAVAGRPGNGFAGRAALRGVDNDPSAGSPTETLLRLLLPLNDKVQWTSRDVAGSEPPTSPRSEHFTGPFNR